MDHGSIPMTNNLGAWRCIWSHRSLWLAAGMAVAASLAVWSAAGDERLLRADIRGFPDADGDGYAEDVDCNDTNAAVNPDKTEVCDEIDNDCDGNVDEGALDRDCAAYLGNGHADCAEQGQFPGAFPDGQHDRVEHADQAHEDGQAGQASAVSERIIPDRGDAFGDRHASHISTTFERTFPDSRVPITYCI